MRISEVNSTAQADSIGGTHGVDTRIKILDAKEAAALIRMDSRTLIRWARLGHVPAHPLGEGKRRLWRFIEAELLEWFQPAFHSPEATTSA